MKSHAQIAAEAREPYARLVSELVGALKAIVSDCQEVLDGRESYSPELLHSIVNGKARAALAKAEGR